MAGETFLYRYFINAPAAHIYEHLAHPENYVGLSPLIVAVSDVVQSTDADGRTVIRYRQWATAQGLLTGDLPTPAALERLVSATLPTPFTSARSRCRTPRRASVAKSARFNPIDVIYVLDFPVASFGRIPL